jgi:hypothetical protein
MSALRSLPSLLIIGLILGGCWYSSSVSGSKDGTADIRASSQAVATTTPQQAQAFVSGRTWRDALGSYRRDIHYSTADGRDFAWFTEQRHVAVGEWRIETGPDGRGQPVTKLCLRYPAEDIHPLSKGPGAEWHCRAAGMVFYWVRERVNGDPLRLAERTEMPFVPGMSRETISQLQARLPR